MFLTSLLVLPFHIASGRTCTEQSSKDGGQKSSVSILHTQSETCFDKRTANIYREMLENNTVRPRAKDRIELALDIKDRLIGLWRQGELRSVQ